MQSDRKWLGMIYPQRLTPFDPLPPLRFYILTFQQSSQLVLPVGDQVLKHMGSAHIQSIPQEEELLMWLRMEGCW